MLLQPRKLMSTEWDKKITIICDKDTILKATIVALKVLR
jgi:hypothetical protein